MRKSQIFITPYPLFMKIKVQISVGELFDKISILEIKKNMITEPTKISNILKELITLEKVCKKKDLLYKKDPNYNKLFKVNRLSDKNKIDTIYVFCGSTFSDEDLNDIYL